MRTAYFVFVLLLAGLSFLCSKNTPVEPLPDPEPVPCDPEPCIVVSQEGFWNITVKHTTSPNDHYELRQMIEHKFETVWQHTFLEAGHGEFVDFRVQGSQHPDNPFGVIVKNSRAEMFVWFETMRKRSK